MIGKWHTSCTLEDILNKVDEGQILNYYFGITTIPFRMKSPLRDDRKPSFGLYSTDGIHIHYKDFATGEQGSLFDLLMKMFGITFKELIDKLVKDMNIDTNNITIHKSSITHNSVKMNNSQIRLEVKTREWRDYDIKYWESYGCNIDLLKYAEVYPISHKIIYKDNKRYLFGAPKLSYVFIERKEGIITKKIYNPMSTDGYKWTSSNDKSVIGLWSKVPECGDTLLICSSLKDAICVRSNTNLPTIYIQSENTGLSDSAISCLKKRYTHIYIAFDGDEAGNRDANMLSMSTGFPVIKCPLLKDKQGHIVKDYSDIYHYFGKKRLLDEFNLAFSSIQEQQNKYNDLPFWS